MAEVRRNWNRREAIGLTVATTLVLAGCGKAARGPGGSGGEIANRGTILEAADAGAGKLQLTSLRNKATGFEWLAARQSFSPLATTGSPASRIWQPLPSAIKESVLSVRAASGDGLQAELEVAANGETGAFRWLQSY